MLLSAVPLRASQFLGVALHYTLMPRLMGTLCLAMAIETSSSSLLLSACFRELAVNDWLGLYLTSRVLQDSIES